MRSNGKNVRWLHRQLPDWVSAGLVPPESAQKLRQLYPEPTGGGAQRLIFPVLAVFGSLLIGGGIVLLFAYNWDELTRAIRTVLSFLPLLIAQAITVRAYLLSPQSAAWREGTGAILAISVVAAIALIGQTYHIPGNLGGLLLTWGLLLLPLFYLLRSVVVFALYLGVIVGWTMSLSGSREGDFALMGFWLLLCAAAPGLVIFRGSLWAGLLKWAVAISLCLGTLFSFQTSFVFLPQVWIPFFSFFFAFFFLLDPGPEKTRTPLWSVPFRVVGMAGIFILSFLLTFGWTWENLFGPSSWTLDALDMGIPRLFLFALPAVLAAILFIHRWPALNLGDRLTAASGAWIPVLFFVHLVAEPMIWFAPVVMSLYVAGLGIAAIFTGLREARIGTLNWGLFVFSALLLARFFDGSVGIIPRALAFIGIGTAFLVINGVLSKRLGREKKKREILAEEGSPPADGNKPLVTLAPLPGGYGLVSAAESFARFVFHLDARKRVGLLLVVFAAQLAVPLAMIGQRELILHYGESLKFHVLPVDPYDPFRGRYVALSYPGYSIPRAHLDFEPEFREVVYARFVKDDDGFARLAEISQSPFVQGAYLRTRVRPHWAWDDQADGRGSEEPRVAVEIPFDRYYMNEAKAPEAERLVRRGSWTLDEGGGNNFIRVSIRRGRGVIEGLYLDGRAAEEVAAGK